MSKKSSEYWADRQAKQQAAISRKAFKDIQKQLGKYYAASMKKVIEDFEATYDKLVATAIAGRQPTPADLYKIDKYWKMQAQLSKELQKLGNKEIALLSKAFEKQWEDIYYSIKLPSDVAFSTISTAGAEAMINVAWLPDGKNFSQRLWVNMQRLADTLNENLINCVVTGKKTTELKKLLQERFDVSYHSANTLVRTELAHIQVEAASKRYQDYGLKYYKFLADTDDRTCKHNHSGEESCEELDGKRFLYSEMQVGKNCPPMHPNCRCTIIPVIE